MKRLYTLRDIFEFRIRRLLRLIFLMVLLSTPITTCSQELEFVNELRPKGTIQSIRPGQMVIVNENGQQQTFKIQEKNPGAVSLEGGTVIVNAPAKIKVSGKMGHSVLRSGWVVKFKTAVTRSGKIQAPVEYLELLNIDQPTLVQQISEPASSREPFEAEITGRVVATSASSIKVLIPTNDSIKKKELIVPLSSESQILIVDNDLGFVQPGDIVTACLARETKAGDKIIGEIHIEMVPRKELTIASEDERLAMKYALLSNEPPERHRKLQSKHFLIHTDVSDRDGQILLAKLETTLEHVSRYLRVRPHKLIECYVVENLDRWPRNQFDNEAVERIKKGRGFTVVKSKGNLRKVTVFSAADHSTVESEVVVAFCAQSFPAIGPRWFSKGFAHVGKNLSNKSTAVDVHPVIVEYLRDTPHPSFERILSEKQFEADGWKDSAWRWALCHLLAHNPNYQKDFKRLVPELLNDTGISFSDVFGNRAQQIQFEYNMFVNLMQNGLRADLISWDWNKKTRKMTINKRVKQKVTAARGWQATTAQVEAGKTYSVKASGTWQLSPEGKLVDGDGHENKQGKLMGVILNQFELGIPFEIGKEGEFTPTTDGQLFLRCYDNWAELDDNQGEIEVEIRVAK